MSKKVYNTNTKDVNDLDEFDENDVLDEKQEHPDTIPNNEEDYQSQLAFASKQVRLMEMMYQQKDTDYHKTKKAFESNRKGVAKEDVAKAENELQQFRAEVAKAKAEFERMQQKEQQRNKISPHTKNNDLEDIAMDVTKDAVQFGTKVSKDAIEVKEQIDIVARIKDSEELLTGSSETSRSKARTYKVMRQMQKFAQMDEAKEQVMDAVGHKLAHDEFDDELYDDSISGGDFIEEALKDHPKSEIEAVKKAKKENGDDFKKKRRVPELKTQEEIDKENQAPYFGPGSKTLNKYGVL